MGSLFDVWHEVREEGKGGPCHVDGPLVTPHRQGVVELLRRREREKVPGIPAIVHVLDVPANSDCRAPTDTEVDGPATEGVGYGLVVREGAVAAGLEGRRVAAQAGVKRVY